MNEPVISEQRLISRHLGRRFVRRKWLAHMGACLSLALIGVACSGPETSQPASTSAPNPPSNPSPMAASHRSAGGEKTFGRMKVTVPPGWAEQPPTSSMRQAQFALARAEGDPADGELVVFYFGSGQGGSVEANIDRWLGQFAQPDGSSSKDKAKISKREVTGLAVTLVDLAGTYQAPMMPGAPQRHNNAGYRMLAAVVETPEGPWFFKLVGPEKTIAQWSGSFDAFVNSIKKS